MKKNVLLLCLLLTVSVACAQEHVHAPSGLIDLDLNERWEVCECGERLNITEHVWATDDWGDKICMTCGAQQYLWEDGMLELCGVDEYGSSVRQLSWSAEGELLTDSASRYEYDAEGHVLYAWYYEKGELFAESQFALDATATSTRSARWNTTTMAPCPSASTTSRAIRPWRLSILTACWNPP